jgi:hypothetical protein
VVAPGFVHHPPESGKLREPSCLFAGNSEYASSNNRGSERRKLSRRFGSFTQFVYACMVSIYPSERVSLSFGSEITIPRPRTLFPNGLDHEEDRRPSPHVVVGICWYLGNHMFPVIAEKVNQGWLGSLAPADPGTHRKAETCRRSTQTEQFQ